MNILDVVLAPEHLESAKNPAGQVACEARFLKCDFIRAKAEDDEEKVLEQWETPLCPWTVEKLKGPALRIVRK